MSETLKVLLATGIKSNTLGTTISSPTKNVVSVELILLLVSFTINVILYCPVILGIMKLLLYVSLASLLIIETLFKIS